MQPIARYALETHVGAYADWPSTTRLIVDGRLIDAAVSGYIIDAQYRTRYGTLLVTSFDCPYEESSQFLLLDDTHRIIASAELGAPCASWLLDTHWPTGALSLALHYYTGVFYTLDILPPARWLGRHPRLQLRPCPCWQEDARMREARAALIARVDAVAKANPDG